MTTIYPVRFDGKRLVAVFFNLTDALAFAAASEKAGDGWLEVEEVALIDNYGFPFPRKDILAVWPNGIH